MKRVLFICVHNSGRSQMAEAFLKHLAQGSVEADSAGTIPSERVNPVVAQVMSERGIDVSLNSPRLLTQEMVDRADRVITMGCSIEEACPALFIPSEDWGLEDPEGKPLAEVRRIRDQIEEKVRFLIADL
ncbi:MAG: protein-tyrosine-phosphatase family, putative arsenate reductase [Dehalococcoidia bacterium]|nr:protein-tyrosine-phosphatase family, putative arsenate reductase [Dehalococcoidia bacterium]